MPFVFPRWGHLGKFSFAFGSFKKAIGARGKPESLIPKYLETVRFFLSALNESDISLKILSMARESRTPEISKYAYNEGLVHLKRATRYIDISIDLSKKMKDDWEKSGIYRELDKIGSQLNWEQLGEQFLGSVGELELDLNEYVKKIWDATSSFIREKTLAFAWHFGRLLSDCKESLSELEEEIVKEMRDGQIDPILTWKKAALAGIAGAVIGACLGSGCTACVLALSGGSFAIKLTCEWKSESKK